MSQETSPTIPASQEILSLVGGLTEGADQLSFTEAAARMKRARGYFLRYRDGGYSGEAERQVFIESVKPLHERFASFYQPLVEIANQLVEELSDRSEQHVDEGAFYDALREAMQNFGYRGSDIAEWGDEIVRLAPGYLKEIEERAEGVRVSKQFGPYSWQIYHEMWEEPAHEAGGQVDVQVEEASKAQDAKPETAVDLWKQLLALAPEPHAERIIAAMNEITAYEGTGLRPPYDRLHELQSEAVNTLLQAVLEIDDENIRAVVSKGAQQLLSHMMDKYNAFLLGNAREGLKKQAVRLVGLVGAKFGADSQRVRTAVKAVSWLDSHLKEMAGLESVWLQEHQNKRIEDDRSKDESAEYVPTNETEKSIKFLRKTFREVEPEVALKIYKMVLQKKRLSKSLIGFDEELETLGVDVSELDLEALIHTNPFDLEAELRKSLKG